MNYHTQTQECPAIQQDSWPLGVMFFSFSWTMCNNCTGNGLLQLRCTYHCVSTDMPNSGPWTMTCSNVRMATAYGKKYERSVAPTEWFWPKRAAACIASTLMGNRIDRSSGKTKIRRLLLMTRDSVQRRTSTLASLILCSQIHVFVWTFKYLLHTRSLYCHKTV